MLEKMLEVFDFTVNSWDASWLQLACNKTDIFFVDFFFFLTYNINKRLSALLANNDAQGSMYLLLVHDLTLA